jgi:hypothetical protein
MGRSDCEGAFPVGVAARGQGVAIGQSWGNSGAPSSRRYGGLEDVHVSPAGGTHGSTAD